MRITLERQGGVAFDAKNDEGNVVRVDGPPSYGGIGSGMRPMQLVLTALASCSAVDVVHILNKQKEPLEDLKIEAEAERGDTVPSPFLRAELRFTAKGALNAGKLERAVRLAVTKYCSVGAMLVNVPVSFRVFLDRGEGTVEEVPVRTDGAEARTSDP